MRGRLHHGHVLNTLVCERETFLFIGTQLSNLYTAKENKTAVSGTAAPTVFSQCVADCSVPRYEEEEDTCMLYEEEDKCLCIADSSVLRYEDQINLQNQ